MRELLWRLRAARWTGTVFQLCLLGLLLVPLTASSQDLQAPSAPRLFEGNLGFDGDWLYVFGSSTMSSRVYWYALSDDVIYQVQFATDEGFTSVVSDVDGVDLNWVEPYLDPGFYYFRVRATDFSANTGPWSATGTVAVVADSEVPSAAILSPQEGDSFTKGGTISIELEVSDDTILRLARFTINGDYAGFLGLKTKDLKLFPSFGESRTVVFDAEVPKNAKSLEIMVTVSDVMYNSVTRTVVLGGSDGGSAGGSEAGSKTPPGRALGRSK